MNFILTSVAKRKETPRKLWTVLFVLLLSNSLFSQTHATSGLSFTETVPKDLLASRSVVLHDYTFQQSELEEIQRAFQQIGIDAVAYFKTDVVMSGKDITKAFGEYFTSRQIKYLIFFEKSTTGFQLIAVTFDPKNGLFDRSLQAWRIEKERLNELSRTAFQDSWRSQKKQNFLVNQFPETDISVDPMRGSRQEFYAIDLKVDNLAVPKFGNETMDHELEKFFQNNYPLKYTITENGADEKELKKQGFLYVLCFVHTRGKAAREILGYDMARAESTYASIAFPNGQLQLKTIPADTEVYKFYFRHIGNGNIFLGNKWDADVSWLDALRNHVMGFKLETKIN